MQTLDERKLMTILGGWDGYNRSLISAIAPLTKEELVYRSAADRRSIGEIGAHIAFGRIDWFHRMSAPGSSELFELAAPVWQAWGKPNNAVSESAQEIVLWLERSWQMIEDCLMQWTVVDLDWSYRQEYGGNTYAVSRQWVIWRIMAHDIHHGGQLTVLLSAIGIEPADLGDNGGHIVEPPVA